MVFDSQFGFCRRLFYSISLKNVHFKQGGKTVSFWGGILIGARTPLMMPYDAI